MHLNEATEHSFRDELIAYASTVTIVGHVFDRRRLISSRNDFIEKLGIEVEAETLIRYVEIELVDLNDDPDEGFDDCPVAVATYNFHFFHQFKDEFASGGNSDRDFTDALLQFRSKFLSKRFFLNGTVQTQPLKSGDYTQFGQDAFTDMKGYSKDQTLEVRFYDEAN